MAVAGRLPLGKLAIFETPRHSLDFREMMRPNCLLISRRPFWWHKNDSLRAAARPMAFPLCFPLGQICPDGELTPRLQVTAYFADTPEGYPDAPRNCGWLFLANFC